MEGDEGGEGIVRPTRACCVAPGRPPSPRPRARRATPHPPRSLALPRCGNLLERGEGGLAGPCARRSGVLGTAQFCAFLPAIRLLPPAHPRMLLPLSPAPVPVACGCSPFLAFLSGASLSPCFPGRPRPPRGRSAAPAARVRASAPARPAPGPLPGSAARRIPASRSAASRARLCRAELVSLPCRRAPGAGRWARSSASLPDAPALRPPARRSPAAPSHPAVSGLLARLRACGNPRPGRFSPPVENAPLPVVILSLP